MKRGFAALFMWLVLWVWYLSLLGRVPEFAEVIGHFAVSYCLLTFAVWITKP